ncbi:MAG TPA: DNA polymerase III subunit gamma/tau, partial [Stellaceae bacterium]|nr:DNA polymerase III subunit gamma/tau [Stellaceae bacterium]
TEGAVRDMLGVADKGLVFDLLEQVMKGDAAAALKGLGALYDGGADPVLVLGDLLDLTHFLMRLKLTPEAGEGDPAMEGERARGLPLAQKLGVPVLARAWQMLLKGLAEAQTAPSPLQAVEMVLVRLAYVADLPAPADLVKQLAGEGGGSTGVGGGRAPAAATAPAGNGGAPVSARRASAGEGGAGAPRLAAASEPVALAPGLSPLPRNFLEVVALFDQKREALLRTHLFANVHLVRFEIGRIELRPTEAAPRDLANRLGRHLTEWTGERWVVSVSQEEGAASLREQAAAKDVVKRQEAAEHPLVRAVLETFPGARIEAVRDIARDAASEPDAAAPDINDDERPEGDDL